jgi:PDZ domain-containing protein
MNRRAATFVIAAVLFAAMLVAVFEMPVPYVVLSPGPVTDTLGAIPAYDTTHQQSGPVIQISGTTVEPASGHLYLTTVELLPGSCSAHPALTQTISAWFSKTKTVEPQQVQCPPGVSSRQVQQQGVNEMTQAQSAAIVAAMNELGYRPTGAAVVIDSVLPSAPAAATIKSGDIVVSADGTALKRTQQLIHVVQRVKPGGYVSLVVNRGGTRERYRVQTRRGPQGRAQLGVTVSRRETFNGVAVSIGIDPNAIGGPSAGAALALGIIDKLTPGGITGGKTIAGTGTITPGGKVGPIGGIQQKVAAAVRAGATVFFAPASECADAKAAAPRSLTLISVTTLRSAVLALEAIKSGSSAFPHC